MGFMAIGMVILITSYLICKGIPFFLKEGIGSMLLETDWKPLDKNPKYGIVYMIVTTFFGSVGAIVLAMPIGVFTAIFLVKVAPNWVKDMLEPMIGILAGIPSIIYGMLGLIVITPIFYEIERNYFLLRSDFTMLTKERTSIMPSGGANLMASIVVLAIMVLPTIITMSQTVIKSVPIQLEHGALALGATNLQTTFTVTLKSASSGLLATGILGLGRVMGETMAISFVSGGKVAFPYPFSSVRFLTTALVSEMGYAGGTHREALFAIGLVLYLFEMTLIIIVRQVTKHKIIEKD